VLRGGLLSLVAEKKPVAVMITAARAEEAVTLSSDPDLHAFSVMK